MLIVPTCQRSDVDLVQMGEKVDLEKDRLLERVRSRLFLPAFYPAYSDCRPPLYTNNGSTAACPQFVEFAKATCSKLEDQGYWADYIDPCSGLPMIHRCDSGF